MSWNSDTSRLSLANAAADFNGIVMRGLQSIDIDEKVESEAVYGNGSVSTGATDGKHSCTLKFSTIPEEADNIKKGLGNAFSRVLGSVGISMTNSVDFTTYEIVLTRVKITSISAKLGEAGGQKPSLVDFECMVMDPVQWNGVQAIDNINGSIGVSLGSFALTV